MADEKIIFSMVGVSKTFTNQKKVLNNIYLSFFYGAKIGIIGLNGSGKSTLMKIIAGIDKNFQGEVVFSPGYTVGYLEQEPQLDDNKTVKEIVEEGCAETVGLLKEYEEINVKLCEPMSDDEMNRLIERQGELYEKIDQVNGWEIDSVLERAMDALRCPDADQKVAVLSGGERRRVALCRLLLQQPDVLLLDEPTNHLDAESIDWLEQHLQQYKGTVIAVTHDRYFLDNVAGWILELDRGEGIPWKGNYSGWLDLTLGLGDKHAYKDIYSTSCHELAHASHFSKAGTDFWNQYITYIMTSYVKNGDPYGDGQGSGAGHCSVGEMWGYYMQSKMYKDRYGGSFPSFGISFWFKPQIFRYLDERGLECTDIFKVLDASVTSRAQLKNALILAYPVMKDIIEQVFNRY